VTLALAYLVLYFRYVRGQKFRGIDHEVLESEYAALLDQAGPFSRDELLVGLVQLLQTTLLIIRPFALSPLVTTDYGANLLNDATLACLPALLLFLLPSKVRPGQALLTWPVVHDRLDFGLLLLIGGGMAINEGFTDSGLNIAAGNAVASLVPHVSSFTLQLVVIVAITLCTQIFSSIGTATAMVPVLGSSALEAVVNPMALLLPATVATHFAFLLPTACPANVVVLAKSQDLARPLRLRDFFTNGLPLTVAACLLGALLTYVMGSAVFSTSDPFPAWACEAQPGGCMFVGVPGVVQGVAVEAQACVVDLGTSDGSLCRLWNGTVLDTSAYLSAR